MEELLVASGATVIASPGSRGDSSLVDAFASLSGAADRFEVAPEIPLSQVLWTRSGPYWNGEMARTLRHLPTGTPGAVLLHAQGAGRRAALLGHAQPFVVTEEISGDFDTPGPYLVLVACRLDETGSIDAVRGFAQPILSSRYFMPVQSAFERDVFHALVALQERLDTHGTDCTILRSFSGQAPEQPIEIQLVDRTGSRRELQIQMAAGDPDTIPARNGDAQSYALTPERFADGSFVGWLEGQIAAPRPG
ncbi:hypothetical protein [Sphingobium algorifonticola]|jgi:hypothetical protein|uniref:Uncharacterized protein n=1 Tax=Sphingobium algorifonticola TaxID=2008318 RepID=A0A437J4H5_9SPHN|nr:hypothetical protein [Sphingobium algorifonticola]RVT39617.1 hypothetical protein ENE74_14750 [Sphingobium algorifonticola]